MSGKLFLIPSVIGDSPIDQVLPNEIKSIVNTIRCYIVENERTARRFLIKLGIQAPIDDLTFFVLNKHTRKEDIATFLKPCKEGNVGLLSEAGVPAVADPGSEIVALAHHQNIKVVPLVGPSSILLALMGSGLNGQSFVFHGYLPVKPEDRKRKIKEIEQTSAKLKQTQIFIEAPYRNNQMLKSVIDLCHPGTMVCVACNLTQKDELIKTLPVKLWKKNMPELHKKPTIFLLQKV